MSASKNRELVIRYTRLIEQGDVDDALALTSEDCKFWHPLSGASDKQATRDVLKQMGTMMRSFEVTILGTTAEDDRVSLEVEVHATAATGKAYSNRYHFMYVVRDGKIAESREYVDTAPIKEAFFS